MRLTKDSDLSQFTISQLLDGMFVARVGHLDSPERKQMQAEVRSKIVAELEIRPPKDLVQALINEAFR